ncbi:MAG TPA: hypothetical protein VKQ30_21370, partial [Ktedonobacterales bacterium]|nr:hypothetical protein [Ktedonobacterales bacterium]
ALLEISGAFATSSTPAGDQWRSELAGALQARKYDYVLWDPQSDAFLLKNMITNANYVNIGSLFKEHDEFNIWKSARTPDVEVYVPAERAPSGLNSK